MKANRNEIEQSLARAVQAETPDCLPDILRRLQPQEGAESEMDKTMVQTPLAGADNHVVEINVKRGRWVKAVACMAAALFLVFGVGFGYAYYTPQAVVGLDVNPSIELKVNRSERVLSATPLNGDAEIILGEMDLNNVDLDTAVNALIGSMVKNGYISEIKNSILISVDAKNEKKGAALQQRLSDEVNEALNAYAVDGAVLSQTISEDARLKELARQYSISLGKASLIDQLVSGDSTLRYQELAALSVNDLNLLIEARKSELKDVAASGKANSGAYIGEAKAKSLALSRAGVKESDASGLRVKLDFENGRMVYEVEFYSGGAEYEIEVGASDGEIVKFDRDVKEVKQPSSQTSADPAALTLDEAKAAALKDAGVKSSAATMLEQKTDWDDGKLQYEFKFTAGGVTYEYEIDAATGTILKREQKTGQSSSQTAAALTLDEAKAAALKDAGVKSSAAAMLEQKTDWDDGKLQYEFKFTAGGVTYEYEIDAATGTILKREQKTGQSSSQTGGYIGEAKAKAAALSHAKVSAGNIWGYKCELDEDDGRMTYDVKFYSGNTEYEYDIDAVTGEIISWDAETEKSAGTISASSRQDAHDDDWDDDDDYDDHDDDDDDDDDDDWDDDD